MLQELWLQKLDWDESIPLNLETCWIAFKESLLEIHKISMPRFVNISNERNIEIHGFADASSRAYGCCLYVRAIINDVVVVRLLTAKSKVAPTKTRTLPRLELCAAHLLAKLWNIVEPIVKENVKNLTFWSDSEIILHWLKMHPSNLNVFVANRVADIQEYTKNASWRHVPTKENPADIVSRGCNVEELLESIWFEGPKFLLKNSNEWPVNPHFQLNEEQKTLEVKKQKTVLHAFQLESNIIFLLIEKYSSYKIILRIVALIYKFIDLLKHNKNKSISCELSVKDYEWAFLKIVETLQKVQFAEEIKLITKCEPIKSSLQKLNLFNHHFEDDHRKFDLLRVGGRLLNAPINYDSKFPLLLSKNSKFVYLYVQHLHLSNYHAGPTVLKSLLRQKIWLVNAREVTRKVVKDCVHCFRYKPKLLSQIMGNLPADRFLSVRPFLICGVDFCGPVYTTYRIRGKPLYKTYICIFVCFTSKAVHIEPVSDLSTNSFILVLKRFIGRRGLPEKIYSDNATNFVGASNRMKEYRDHFFAEGSQQQLKEFAAERGVQFVFIPPRSPHFGGLWEAAVKSTKTLMYKTVGNANLTFEELATILVEIEAILNSRPLVPMSEDPNDPEALTPAHMLVGASLKALPSQDFGGTNINTLDRFQRISALKQHFWSVFQRDYILEQQNRAKWSKPHESLEVGAMVVVHEDNTPPQKWLLGRVVDVVTGADGKVRVAYIKTRNGLCRRAIHKLAILPSSSSSSLPP